MWRPLLFVLGVDMDKLKVTQEEFDAFLAEFRQGRIVYVGPDGAKTYTASNEAQLRELVEVKKAAKDPQSGEPKDGEPKGSKGTAKGARAAAKLPDAPKEPQDGEPKGDGTDDAGGTE